MKAIDESGIAPVGDPKVDLGDMPGEGKPLIFSFEVGVRPTAELGTYRGIEVGRREPSVDDEAIDEEVEELRERSAHLHTVKRPAKDGDFLTIDFEGTVGGEPFPGGEGRDQLIELGSGNLIPGFEEGLHRRRRGRAAHGHGDVPRGLRRQARRRQGRGVRDPGQGRQAQAPARPRRRLRLRRGRLRHARRAAREHPRAHARARRGARRVASSAPPRWTRSSSEATVEVPEALVEARANELLTRMLHALGHQGIDKAAYLKISGKTERELVDDAKPEAELALKREAVLAAIIKAEAIEPTEQQLLDALEGAAEREQMSRQKLLARCARPAASTGWPRRSRPSRRSTSSSPRPSRSRSRRRRSARRRPPRPRRRPLRPKPKRKPAARKKPAKAEGRALDARQGRRGRGRQEALDAGRLGARRRVRAVRTRGRRLVGCPGRTSRHDA